MSGYTNYQLPPNYGYQQQQYQQQQYQQQQYQQQQQQYAQQPAYPTQYPQYMREQSSDSYYPRPAPAPVSAPLPSYGYQQTSSPAPSLYSASTASSYNTAPSSNDDLFGMFSSSPAPVATQTHMAPRPVTPDNSPRQMNRAASSNEDLQAVIAAQERALVQSKQPQARSVPIVQRKDYVVPRDIKGKRIISDAIHPEKYEMKKNRKQHTVAGATSGAIVGGLLAGPAFPIGMAVGGAVGGYASNKMHKMQERRRQRRHEQRNFQKGAKNTTVAKSDFAAFV